MSVKDSTSSDRPTPWRFANPERYKATSKAYYQKNKSKINAQRRERHSRNPERERERGRVRRANGLTTCNAEYQRNWKLKHPAYYKEYFKKYFKSNPDVLMRQRESSRAINARHRSEISDCYVSQLARLSRDSIPLEFILAYRSHLKLKRLIKSHEKHQRPKD